MLLGLLNLVWDEDPHTRGKELRSRHGVEVESVFGNIKQNIGFRKLMFGGLEKVTTEWGQLFLTHNMKNLAALS